MKRKQKNLTVEEIKLWKKYVQNISTIENSVSALPSNKIETTDKSGLKNIKFNAKKKSSNHVTPGSIRIDKKIHTKLKNGVLRPERTLDLHGLTYDNAYAKVVKFVNTGYQDGKRLLLVITGKGKSHAKKENFSFESNCGVLRKAFPNWLRSDKLKDLILNVSQAHAFHGGEGAYYVYLRKNNYKT